MYKETILDRLNRKFGRFAIPHLMNYIVVGMAVVFIMDILVTPATGFSFTPYLAFDREAILSGQVWRILSFVLIPTSNSLFFIIFSLYFYWLIGNALESEWGAFRFNVFYICGVLGTMAAGLITGYATNYYLNLSLFLAFALLYPDFKLLLFFILPIKIKYIALIDAVSMAVMLITDRWPGKIALLVAIGNILLFFWRPFIQNIKNLYRRIKWKMQNRR